MSARARCIAPFLSPLHDSERYPARNAVERSRGWLKHGRHVAARYGQYAQRYLCFLYPAGAWLWLNSNLNINGCFILFPLRGAIFEASAARNCQSMPVWAMLRASVQAATYAWTAALPGAGGLTRQAAQFRFGSMETVAVPGRKHQRDVAAGTVRPAGPAVPVQPTAFRLRRRACGLAQGSARDMPATPTPPSICDGRQRGEPAPGRTGTRGPAAKRTRMKSERRRTLQAQCAACVCIDGNP